MNLYGTLSEIEYSPNLVGFDKPLSLATVKEFLNLPHLDPEDTDKDEELETLIDAAVEIAEEESGHDIQLKQYLLLSDSWPCDSFRLRHPLVSVDRVRYRDTSGVWHDLENGTDYIVDFNKKPGSVTRPVNVAWPSANLWPTSPIEVYFSSGYASADDVPAKLRQGMLIMIREWFTNDPNPSDKVHTRLLRGMPRV